MKQIIVSIIDNIDTPFTAIVGISLLNLLVAYKVMNKVMNVALVALRSSKKNHKK